MPKFNFLNEQDAEDLIEHYAYLKENYHDFLIRSDYVNWSEENEKQAFEEYWECRKKLINLLTGKVEGED